LFKICSKQQFDNCFLDLCFLCTRYNIKYFEIINRITAKHTIYSLLTILVIKLFSVLAFSDSCKLFNSCFLTRFRIVILFELEYFWIVFFAIVFCLTDSVVVWLILTDTTLCSADFIISWLESASLCSDTLILFVSVKTIFFSVVFELSVSYFC